MYVCPNGHEIHSAADRDGQGYCRRCRADGARTFRGRQRAALELATALEAEGVEFMTTDRAQLAAALVAGYTSESRHG
jgi:hypothetical protein